MHSDFFLCRLTCFSSPSSISWNFKPTTSQHSTALTRQFLIDQAMAQARCPAQTLPRIHGAAAPTDTPPQTCAATDAHTPESLTAGWTGPAALRRVYAPVPPIGVTSKAAKWRDRSPKLAGGEASRGHGHHLVPLDPFHSPQKRYSDDARRFLIAVEESQRTALKFDERRHRLRLERVYAAEDRLIDAQSCELYSAEVPLLRLCAEEEEAPTKVSPTREELRPWREYVAGQMVDSLLQAQCAEGSSRPVQRPASPIPPPPPLQSTEEQLPSLRAREIVAPTTPPASAAADNHLRRIRSAAASSLMDEWWPSFVEAGATAKRQHAASNAEAVPVLHATEEEDARPSAVSSSEADLRRERRAVAAQLIDGAVAASWQTRSLPPPLRATEAMSPHSAKLVVSSPRDHAEPGLRLARKAEASAWVGEAFSAHNSDAARSLRAVSCDVGPQLRATDLQLPRFVEYVAEPPRVYTPASSVKSAEGKTESRAVDGDDGDVESDTEKEEEEVLRAVRAKEAAAWVRDAFARSATAQKSTGAVSNAPSLYEARRAEAAACVSEAFASQRRQPQTSEASPTSVVHDAGGKPGEAALLPPSPKQPLRVAGEAAPPLFATDEKFHATAVESRLHSSIGAAPSLARDPIRASVTTTTASSQQAPQEQQQDNESLREARRGVARTLVCDAWQSHFLPVAPSAPASSLTLRQVRRREAALLVATVM